MIGRMDRREMFLNPVTPAEAPDYFDIVQEPMCWLYIDEKLEKNAYIDVADFKVGWFYRRHELSRH